MRYPINRFLKSSLLILVLVCFTGLAAKSSRNSFSISSAEAPMRLRIKVENNTLAAGQSTRITAEFLDRLYQQVPNNGTRVLEFGFAPPPGARVDWGSFTPQRLTVGAGAWSAVTTFTSRQTGRVVITARADGLDPAQTVLLVTRPASSLISRLLDPVAYAQDSRFEIWPDAGVAQANGKSRATFQLTFLAPPTPGTKVRVRVDPPATLIYDGKPYGAQADIVLADGKAISENLDVISPTPATVSVKAKVLPNGAEPNGEESRASLKFIQPHPSRILFVEDVKELLSTQHTIPISIVLTDDSGNPLQADAEKRIRLNAANDDDPVSFEPASVNFSPSQNQLFAQTKLRLKGLPLSGEITLLAMPEDNDLKAARTTIRIQSPIKGISLMGPSEVARGKAGAEYVVKLTDKDGMPTTADWDRKVKLYAGYGRFNPNEVIIPRGQDAVRVRYEAAGTTGKVSLRAESGGLKEGAQDIVLITAVYWLLIAALVGGLIGGAVRYFSIGEKSVGRKPVKISINWRALIGTAVGSIASGLFLFLAVKLGLSRALGSLALPLDYGTWLVAFFFGGIGGFAGPAVFERLVSLFLPATPAAQSAPSH